MRWSQNLLDDQSPEPSAGGAVSTPLTWSPPGGGG